MNLGGVEKLIAIFYSISCNSYFADGGSIMQETTVRQCQCPDCLQPRDHPHKELHHHMNLLLSRLDEQQRRWYVALESKRIGHGGDRLLSLITGMNVRTIRRGRQELDGSLKDIPQGRLRRPGAGRPTVEKKVRTWRGICWL